MVKEKVISEDTKEGCNLIGFCSRTLASKKGTGHS